MNEHIEPTAEQITEMERLKSYFPFRLVWGAINPKTNEWRCKASTTNHEINKLLREGWRVFLVT